MAKRTTRKQTRKTGRTKAATRKTTATRKTAARRKTTGTRKSTARRKTAARPQSRARSTTGSRTARQKNAARSAASRSTRRQAKPPEPSRLSAAATTVKGVMASAVAAVARRLPGASADMDAITLLETDHRRLEELLRQGEDTTEKARTTRRELLDAITAELGVHELIEEKLLYPALKRFPEARDIVLEGFQEHHVADVILQELHGVAADDEQWGAKFKVLKENIEHHIEEEEGPMFRTARGVMPQEQLQALGAAMAAMKRDAQRRAT